MVKFQITNSKSQIISNNQIPMIKTNQKNTYDLEERTYQFSKTVSLFCKKLTLSISNSEYSRQVIRASGAVGANYIEANEALSKADLTFRLKICRKEAKESAYWLRLIVETNFSQCEQEAKALQGEAIELKKIFSSIINKL